jgi:hypothetical protein
MFNEVDKDNDGAVTKAEWLNFFENLLDHDYKVCGPRERAIQP